MSLNFEIKPIINQESFEDPSAQSFFSEWCKINDSIEPVFVKREEWEKRRKESILEKNSRGKNNLYIPEDLKLWEMVEVMETIDRDTFSEDNEKSSEKAKKVRKIAKMFQNAGIYIAQRLGNISRGNKIAEALSEEFYNYGLSLENGEKSELDEASTIANKNLTPEEIQAVDIFLAGENLYDIRQAKIEKKCLEKIIDPQIKQEMFEEERRKTLAQFFSISERAFALENKSNEKKIDENNKPTEKPRQNNLSFHSAFINKINSQIKREIEMPKRELERSIFRRGVELLQKNIGFNKISEEIKKELLHWENGEKTLREALEIEKLKLELKNVRESRDAKAIDEKEHEIIDKIQKAVISFPYEKGMNNPSEIVSSQNMNCVGGSMLGGALLSEVGIKYLVSTVPQHSILFIVTSNGNVEWREMVGQEQEYEVIQDSMIVSKKKDGKKVNVNDIVVFSNDSRNSENILKIKLKISNFSNSSIWSSSLDRTDSMENMRANLHKPEHGHEVQLLMNTAIDLGNSGNLENAKKALGQLISLSPNEERAYLLLGDAFSKLEFQEKAIEMYKKAIAEDPEDDEYYYKLCNYLSDINQQKVAIEMMKDLTNGKFQESYKCHLSLGYAFYINGQYQESLDAYEKANWASINYLNDPLVFFLIGESLIKLGENEKAIEAYSRFLRNLNKNHRFKNEAEKKIVELNKLIEVRKKLEK